MMRLYRLEKTAFVQFAFFMGLVGMLYPPVGDFAKYYRLYETYQGLDFDSFLLLALVNFDYTLSFLLYGLSLLGIPCDLSRFIFNFIGYYLMGKLFLQIVYDNNILAERRNRLYALIVFLVFSFSSSIFRYGLATNLFVYGAYYIVYKNNKKYWAVIGLAILTHFTFSVFALLLFLSRKIPLKFKSKFVYSIFLLVFIMGMFNVGVMFDVVNFSGAIFERYKGYLDTADSGQYAHGFSIKLLIWLGFSNFLVLLFYIMFRRYSKRGGKFERSYIDYMLIATALVSPFSVVFGRFFGTLGYFLKFYFFRHYDNSFNMKKIFIVLVWMTLVLDVMNIWAKRREVSVSDMSLLATSTSYTVLTHEYTYRWFSQNVTDLGELIKYDK